MKIQILLSLLAGSLIVFMASFMLNGNGSLRDMNNPEDHNLNQDIPQNIPVRFIKGKITIKLRENLGNYNLLEGRISLGIPSLDDIMSKYGVYRLDKRFTFNQENMREGVPDLSRIYRIDFPAYQDVNAVARAFARDPHVEYAEPIPVIFKCEVPDDLLYSQLYHLPLIFAEEAWDIHHGEDGQEVLIGIVDDAVDWRHNDLVENAWENLGEDADSDGHVILFNGTTWIFDPDDENGIDDDGNGKTDDFVGWDFINEYGEQDNDPTPNLPAIDHGTHCIGIAAGRTNNTLQIASISWNVDFVTAKVSNDANPTLDYDPFDALIYVAELGSDILTNSWVTSFFSQANLEVIQYVQSLGCIVVAAAGNESNEVLYYPASYPGVVSVAATNYQDLKAGFSNYGIAVDVCAPGVDILSLKPNNMTQTMSGTSMATPLAAGMIALAKSYYPEWTNEMILDRVMGTCDDIDFLQPSLANKLGYGRINAFRALTESGAMPQQELRLALQQSAFTDQDGDGIYAPGDTVNLSFSMMNYAVGHDTVPVTFSLTTSNSWVTVVNGECTLDVPSDNFVNAESVFSLLIHDDLDSTVLVTCTLTATSSLPIPLENEWPLELLINQSGILVFNGDGTGNAYSGEFIRDYLMANSPYPVYYTQVIPSSLTGFDAVFLSFGNYGANLENGTVVSYEMSQVIADYLYSGGYLYEDCGSFFGCIDYGEYPNLEEIAGLFSVDSIFTPMISNTISLLTGLPGSEAEGISFHGSTQSPNFFIDLMFPDSNGTAMFEEEGYGVVAVQGEGDFGQRTICFGYSIAHLEDDTLGTREELMTRIALFFELIGVGAEESVATESKTSIDVYPNPTGEIVQFAVYSPREGLFTLKIYDAGGREVATLIDGRLPAGERTVRWDASELSSGVYYYQLRSANRELQSASGKIVKY